MGKSNDLGILTNMDAKKAIKARVKDLTKAITDIDFDDYLNAFLEHDGYKFNNSVEENVVNFIQYCGMRKGVRND